MSTTQAYNDFWTENEKKNKRKGAITTIVIHCVILLLFLLFGLTRPWPPPAEQGILINFGTVDAGSGKVQPTTMEQPQEVSQVQPTPPQVTPQVQQEVATQQVEEAPSIQQKPETKVETKPAPDPVKPQPQPEQKPVEPKPDPRFAFPGAPSNQNQSGSEGTTTFDGDQGRPHGQTDPGAYTGDRSTGRGTEGVGFDLAGRSRIHIPIPRDNSAKEGTVVITIRVDKEGNVIDADFRLKGSTVQDPTLRQLAIDAAKKAKFSASPNAPEEQIGTITFVFKNQ